MPESKGRFHLISDTSKFATGCALYQIQNCKPKPIAYASKRLPEAAWSYSITELEICGLAINIASFVHVLKRVDFDAIVDHLALTHILKSSKAEPTTTRIKRLLEVLSFYSFNLYYIKGKAMIISDFPSRQKHDDNNPYGIIPISFNMQNMLQTRYYNTGERAEGKYLVHTRSQTKPSGIILPEVHGIDKGIDPNIRPEEVIKSVIISQTHITPEAKGISQVKQRLDQGRAGIKIKTLKFSVSQLHDKHEQPKLLSGRKSIAQIEKRPIQPKTRLKISTPEISGHPDKVIPVSNYTIPQTMSECDSVSRTIRRKGMQDIRREIPSYADAIYRPHPKLNEIPRQVTPRKILESEINTLEQDINMDFEENFPYQEGMISETYQWPD